MPRISPLELGRSRRMMRNQSWATSATISGSLGEMWKIILDTFTGNARMMWIHVFACMRERVQHEPTGGYGPGAGLHRHTRERECEARTSHGRPIFGFDCSSAHCLEARGGGAEAEGPRTQDGRRSEFNHGGPRPSEGVN